MSDRMICVAVEAVEVCGPGLENWLSARPVFAGSESYRAASMVLPPPGQLSPAERRRAIPSVRLALMVGAGAVEQAGYMAAALPAVFASSGADGDTISAIFAALVTPAREVSPTRFHNSVHNAPSGYWGIATQSREAVTSLSGYDASFGAGLLEAAVQAISGNRPILLVAYDLPYPEPLNSARRIEASFGAAFVLSSAPSDRALATLKIGIATDPTGKSSRCSDPGLEQLRRGNPAARSLPLLVMLASRSAGWVCLDLSYGSLDIAITPC
jgi:Beta-ketoacyl synthase, N-terminal domain